MFVNQSSLGQMEIYKAPRFDQIQFARVTSILEFEDHSKVQVRFNDGVVTGGVPLSAYVIQNGVDITPNEGDIAVLGYIDAKKEHPYVIGFLKGRYKHGDRINVNDDGVFIDFPVGETGLNVSLHMNVDGTVLLNAPFGMHVQSNELVSVNAKNIDLSATELISVGASNVTIDGSSSVNVAGSGASVNVASSASVSGSSVSVSGTNISIDGSTNVTVSGKTESSSWD